MRYPQPVRRLGTLRSYVYARRWGPGWRDVAFGIVLAPAELVFPANGWTLPRLILWRPAHILGRELLPGRLFRLNPVEIIWPR